MKQSTYSDTQLQYEAPQCAVLDTQTEGFFCQSFGADDWTEGNDNWFTE